MITLDSIEQAVYPKRFSAFTIGSFDGVHKGHQFLIHSMRQLVGVRGSVCALTFTNHPTHVIKKAAPVELILSRDQKLRWLEAFGVDIAYCVPFTQELAATLYQDFLEKMLQSCPFDHLVLGKGAHLGNQKQGTPSRVTEFCKSRGVQAHYIDKLESASNQISSKRIRKLLRMGKVSSAIKLMGHPIDFSS